MKIKKILLTGANGDIALSIGRALQSSLPNIRLVGCDIGGEWPGRTVFKDMFTVPLANDDRYLTTLRKMVSKVDVDLILPCTEPELLSLVRSDTSDLNILMNDAAIIMCCLDKYKTAEWLQSLGVLVPSTKNLSDACVSDLPLMVKPRSGSGSRGLEIITNLDHLSLAQAERSKDTIAQQLLDPHEGEFTCPIFKAHGEVRTLIMRRWLTGGLTGRMIVEDIPIINHLLDKIADALPDIAAINVQLRLMEGVPFVFEINPRLSSTVMMRNLIGFSDALWWVQSLMGVKPPAFTPAVGTKVYRTYSEVVVKP